MVIELLTGLHPYAAREVADDTLFEVMPEEIMAHHDGTAAEMPASNAYPSTPKCAWPQETLLQLSGMAAKCVRGQHSLRATVAEFLPALEQLDLS